MNNLRSAAVAVLFSLISSLTHAQSLSGVVVNENDAPLAGVAVSISALHRMNTSDENGKFLVGNLPPANYLVEFSLLGFKKETREVGLASEDVRVRITLIASPLELPAVTVTAEPQPSSIQESPLSTTVIEGRQLQRERGQSLGQTIENAPGVAMFSGSPLAMKPVIRGLSAQRVLVMSGGVRLESQTWDEPQSPEINVLDVDRIEIVRGTNSVLYGSDALGGVINIVKPELQSASEGAPILRGIVTLNALSNSPQVASGISLNGASGLWNYRGNFTARFADDYSTPAGRTADGGYVSAGKVFNSGGNEFDGGLTVGTKRDWGTLIFDATHFGQKYFIAPEPGRKEYELNINTMAFDSIPAAPNQEILHETGTLYADLPLSFARLELTGTYQRNSRKEEGAAESDADEQKKANLGIKPEAQLILNTLSFDAKAHHRAVGPLLGTVGLSSTIQDNATVGRNAIIPNFASANLAGYIYEEYRAPSDLRVTGGLRFDSRRLHAKANDSLGNVDEIRNFNAATGTFGVSWNAVEPLTFAVNVGRGWRAPVAAELYFKGSDEGAVRYKLGDHTLTPEASVNVDGSVRYASSSLAGEISVYQNKIDHYIFLSPTGQQVSGLDSYKYKQANATLVGGEFSLQGELATWCVASGGVDIVRGTNDETNSPLPLIPANRIRAGLRFEREKMAGVSGAYASVRVRHSFEQNRLGLFESATPAYSLLDIGVGGEVSFASHKFMVDLLIDNALDKAYYDHLSRYKEFALDPGRNFVLKVSLPFDAIP